MDKFRILNFKPALAGFVTSACTCYLPIFFRKKKLLGEEKETKGDNLGVLRSRTRVISDCEERNLLLDRELKKEDRKELKGVCGTQI